jgi:hypothetical protein
MHAIRQSNTTHNTERSSERLMAALQLGSASLALAAAEQLNDRQPEAQAALSHAVSQLRWVLDVGASDLQRLSGAAVQVRMRACARRAWSQGHG